MSEVFNDNELGKRMKQIREVAGLSQAELGELLSTGKRTISDYETGKIVPRLDYIKHFCQYFNLSIDTLVGQKEYASKYNTSRMTLLDLDENELHLINSYRHMDDDMKIKSLQIMDILRETSERKRKNSLAEAN